MINFDILKVVTAPVNLGAFKKAMKDIDDEILKLEEYIKLCKSHQNHSNWDLIEAQIKHIESLIKELRNE